MHFAKQLLSNLKGNPDFPAPNPPLEDFAAAISATEFAHAELDTAKTVVTKKVAELESRRQETISMVKQLALYVENVSKGDEAKIKGSGLGVKASATKRSVPAIPENLQAAATGEGEMSLSWNTVEGARSYIIQMTKDPAGLEGWEIACVSTRSKAVVTNLAKLTRYWFRVAAVAPAGNSQWSEPCSKIVGAI